MVVSNDTDKTIRFLNNKNQLNKTAAATDNYNKLSELAFNKITALFDKATPSANQQQQQQLQAVPVDSYKESVQ